MKKVIEQTFGKNGDVIESFQPTSRMMLYAMCKAKNPTWSDPEIAKELGFGQNTISSWKKYGSAFTSWLEEFIDQHAPDKEAELLHAVGMVEALQGSFNHWKEMSKIKGLIKDESSTTKITINTNFEHVSLGDFNEERTRLLSELLGVGKSGRPRLASTPAIDVTPSGKSEGDRASEVQDGQVEMADALGTDRRRR